MTTAREEFDLPQRGPTAENIDERQLEAADIRKADLLAVTIRRTG